MEETAAFCSRTLPKANETNVTSAQTIALSAHAKR
jgi:hypothetical protein